MIALHVRWQTPNGLFLLSVLVKILNGKYLELKQSMDMLTKSSVDNLLKRIMNLASRPIAEFNRFEAMELVEGLKNAAHDVHHDKEGYYRLVYETLRGKLELPNDQFRNFIFPLLGDKDHEKVLDVISKVKTNQRQFGKKSTSEGHGIRTNYLSSVSSLRCYYCNKLGHIRARCMKRKRDMRVLSDSGNRSSPTVNK